MKSNCKKDHAIVFRLLYDVTKLEFFCNTKDRTSKLNESFVVYAFIYVMPTMLAKLKKLYIKDVLNMPGMKKIALWVTILINL